MTKRTWRSIAVALGVSASVAAYAHEAGEKGKDVTMKGEVVDMACYMGHGASGAKHKECADMCIKGGAPMGLLTSDGKVILLVEDHANKAAYDSLKGMAASQVTVSGDDANRGGIHAIVVEKAEKAG